MKVYSSGKDKVQANYGWRLLLQNLQLLKLAPHSQQDSQCSKCRLSWRYQGSPAYKASVLPLNQCPPLIKTCIKAYSGIV